MVELKNIKKRVKKILERRQPLKIIEKRVKKMLERWKKEFPDLEVEEIVLDAKLGIKFGRAALKITMKKKQQ